MPPYVELAACSHTTEHRDPPYLISAVVWSPKWNTILLVKEDDDSIEKVGMDAGPARPDELR